MDKQQLNADIANIRLRKAYIKAIGEIEVDIRRIYKLNQMLQHMQQEQQEEKY